MRRSGFRQISKHLQGPAVAVKNAKRIGFNWCPTSPRVQTGITVTILSFCLQEYQVCDLW